MSKISDIVDLVRSSAKRMQDLGETVGDATKAGAESFNGRTLTQNLGKYSLLPAAAGVGIGAGVGGGVYVASGGLRAAGDNLRETTSLDFTSPEGFGESVSKISGWLILAALVALVVLVFLPALVDMFGKVTGGAKNARTH